MKRSSAIILSTLTVKPNIVISHDGPNTICHSLFRFFDEGSRTRQALDSMLECHKPKLWVFGHWHVNRDIDIMGVRFICVGKDSSIDIEI